MDKVVAIHRLNERELELGLTDAASWHAKYRDSAWVYVGGLPVELTEGDVLCVLSQFGEIEDINMPREKKTGKPRGWCWCKYEDQRSTVLAVDNLTGATLLGRTLRVDHCEKYKLPKELKDREDKYEAGAIYKETELASDFTIAKGQDVFQKPEEKTDDKHKKKKKKKKHKRSSSSDDDDRKKKKKKKKEIAEDDDDFTDGALPLRPEDERLIRAEAAALPLIDTKVAREGEIIAPSWRGTREPGAPQQGHYHNNNPPPPAALPSSYEDREKDRQESFGGMLRRR